MTVSARLATPAGPYWLYDGAADPACARATFSLLANARRLPGERGEFRADRRREREHEPREEGSLLEREQADDEQEGAHAIADQPDGAGQGNGDRDGGLPRRAVRGPRRARETGGTGPER